jgi:hypothetical protein
MATHAVHLRAVRRQAETPPEHGEGTSAARPGSESPLGVRGRRPVRRAREQDGLSRALPGRRRGEGWGVVVRWAARRGGVGGVVGGERVRLSISLACEDFAGGLAGGGELVVEGLEALCSVSVCSVPASLLGALEVGEGSVEGVLQATFVALEAEEGVSLGGGGSEGWGEGVIEELLVQAGEASDLPVADGDLLDEQLFSVGRRLVGLAEVFEVLVEVGLALDDAADASSSLVMTAF